MSLRWIGLSSFFLVLLSCSRQAPYDVPLVDAVARYGHPITTISEDAQRYFDQGLVLYYAFNHEAAILSFKQALAIDSTCAMAWWGIAASLGPNINNPAMDSSACVDAWNAVQRAVELSQRTSAFERDLINALATRYTLPPLKDRGKINRAYANAMRRVYETYKDDPEAGSLFADALLNLRPWDLWTSDGTPMPETPEIVSVLEQVLAMTPDHPGAAHFYIHTMEASPMPEKALGAAQVLRTRIPGAGHLVHMPSHIYIRTGRYADAAESNRQAIRADSAWAAAGGFYTLYRAHNYHFLAYAAMFDGQRGAALDAAKGILRQIPLDVVQQYPDFLEGFYGIPTHVMVRFGMWEEILAEPEPPEDLFVTLATWRYGRTVALSALRRVKEAEAEFSELRKAYALMPESRTIGNNTGKTVLEIGLLMAEGELEYSRGNRERAFGLLREAVAKDDELRYDEPWGWMMPVRHSLGALLLDAGRTEEAERVYRKDLSLHPANGWSLKGLAECLHMTGQHHEAERTDSLFAQAWARSEVPLRFSCFCRLEKGS